MRISFAHPLDSLCPYFTRFPLSFPLRALQHARPGQWVCDPFCGSGTTLLAARLLGLNCIGMDSSSVAVLSARARTAPVDVHEVCIVIDRCLQEMPVVAFPDDVFWTACFAPSTLSALCGLRALFHSRPLEETEEMVCALVLDALHGPLRAGGVHYLSNHMPVSFSPAPALLVEHWKRAGTCAPCADLRRVLKDRAIHFFSQPPPRVSGWIMQTDSRLIPPIKDTPAYDWMVTSPPYFGMNSYASDQWLRNWFMGGPDNPAFCGPPPDWLDSSRPDLYEDGLAQVWRALAARSQPHGRLIIRYGAAPGINPEQADLLLQRSLERDGMWRITQRVKVPDQVANKSRPSDFPSPANRPTGEAEWIALLSG